MKCNGKVKWFDEKKGYGFIHGPEGHDVFVHHTQIVMFGYRKLDIGQRVEYELQIGPRGAMACGVTPTDPA